MTKAHAMTVIEPGAPAKATRPGLRAPPRIRPPRIRQPRCHRSDDRTGDLTLLPDDPLILDFSGLEDVTRHRPRRGGAK